MKIVSDLVGRCIEVLRRTRAKSVAVLAFGLVVIALWQSSFVRMAPTSFDRTHRVTASTGIQSEPYFFFFLYHLGLYPIAIASGSPKVDARAEAERLLREEPRALVQEAGLTFASGERGRTYLYWVDALLRGDRLHPRLRPANALAFGLALAALFSSFWWVGRPGTGALLVALLGSNPFQLDAIHGQDNVFSWSITAMIVLLALHVPLLGSEKRSLRFTLGVAIATGVFMGAVRHVRSEPMPMLVAPLFVYATLARAKVRDRAVPIVLCVVTFFATSAFVARRLEAKLLESRATLAAAGGTPYTGPIVLHHEFWHPVFCGLGDFDETHGYAWDDRRAYAYALRVAEDRAGRELDLNPRFWAQKNSYDGGGVYPVPFFEELPGYHDIVREKVLSDIRREPGWYLGILGKRAARILTTTTPVSLRVGETSIAFSAWWLGPACVALLALLVLARRWADAKLLVFATPLSAVALLVYSDRGMTSYASFHVFGAAIFASLATEGLWRWLRGRRRATFIPS